MDPLRVGFSPFIGIGNNPINLVDKTGGCPTCPGWVEGESNSDVMLQEVTITAPRYFGYGVFDRAVDSWLRDGKNYSTYGRINFGVYETPNFKLFNGSGFSINLVAVGGPQFSVDKVETIDDGIKRNDTYLSFGGALGLDISADVHGIRMFNTQGGQLTSENVEGAQWSISGGAGPTSYQFSSSIEWNQRMGRFVFDETRSHQFGLGIGPSSIGPVSGTVGLSYTINISRLFR
jgi:hypothetical protein